MMYVVTHDSTFAKNLEFFKCFTIVHVMYMVSEKSVKPLVIDCSIFCPLQCRKERAVQRTTK
jgi:hypothetical protein